MRISYDENSVNFKDVYRATVIGRCDAGIFLQLENSRDQAFVRNFHILRNGTKVIGSVRFPPKGTRCMELEIESVLFDDVA